MSIDRVWTQGSLNYFPDSYPRHHTSKFVNLPIIIYLVENATENDLICYILFWNIFGYSVAFFSFNETNYGSIQVPARVWNNAWRGIWGLPPLEKLENRLISFTVLVQRKKKTKNNLQTKRLSGGVVEWLTRRTSSLRIAIRMCSNPVRDKPLFPWLRNFTLIAHYWLVPGTDSRVFI